MEARVLEGLGLSHAEATLYLALLQLGPSTTGPLIDQTGLQSSTVYHVLGSLREKGLISSVLKGKIKHYQAESPTCFLLFLEEKKRKITRILPSLRRMEAKPKEKQTAKVYEGMNGMKTAMNDIILTMRPGEEYLFFNVSSDALKKEKVIRFFRNYHLRRDAKGILVRGLTFQESKKEMGRIHHGLKHSKIRYVGEFFPTGLIIYKNKVITLDWDTLTAFVIQSDSVSRAYKQFFEEKWKTAKP